MWSIYLDLNVVSYVFRSLISFRKSPWYCSVCSVQAIITTTRGILKLSSLSAKRYTADCYLFPFYGQYCYGEVSKLLLFLLSQDTPEEVYLMLLSIDLPLFSHFRYFYIKLLWNFVFLTNIKSVVSWIFYVAIFF